MPEPDMLDQADIDALLNAVESGDFKDEQPPARIFSRFRRDSEKVEIRVYDFKRPERIGKDQMRTLQTLHEGFARGYGAQLSGFLRSIVEVRVATAEQMTYSEFIGSLPNPTCFTLLDCDPLDGQFCVEISPLIVYPFVDRLLGGNNKELVIPQRPMTGIEGRLLQRILGLGLGAMSEAWAGVREIDFGIGAMESNPHLVQIVPPNEVVVVIGFEIKLGNRAGTMSLCMPYNVIEPVMEDLNAENWTTTGRGTTSSADPAIVSRLQDSALQVEATLARTTITLSELGRLEVGDIITTEQEASEPIQVSIEGRPKYLATLGQHRGQRALRIQGPARGAANAMSAPGVSEPRINQNPAPKPAAGPLEPPPAASLDASA
ncbi:MAG: flagellar motor switch protein FliM [Planctomycetota bacterium]|nr:flagellar motor switch protein FliM [Planctomycetota bacterium]